MVRHGTREAAIFHSSYVYWIREYSVQLARLAQSNDIARLKQTVTRFDARMRDKPEDAAALESTMHGLLKVGRFYEAENTATTSPTVDQGQREP